MTVTVSDKITVQEALDLAAKVPSLDKISFTGGGDTAENLAAFAITQDPENLLARVTSGGIKASDSATVAEAVDIAALTALTNPITVGFSIEDTADKLATDGDAVDLAITVANEVTSTDNMTVDQAVEMLDGRDVDRVVGGDANNNDYFDFTISDDYTNVTRASGNAGTALENLAIDYATGSILSDAPIANLSTLTRML